MTPPRFTIGGPLRASLGLLLLATATVLLWTSRGVEWGVAWTMIVPGVLLLIPGWGLLQRRVLTWDGAALTLTDGWLWRRALTIPTTGAELELLPTAGLRAVVLHRGGGSWALATWLRSTTAEHLAAWLDVQRGEGPFPRRIPVLPSGDR